MKISCQRKRNWFSAALLLIAAVFVLSLFSGIAGARSSVSNEEHKGEHAVNDGHTIKTAKEVYEHSRERYRKFRDRYEDKRNDFVKAEKKFREARKKFRLSRDSLSRDELVNRTRDYLEKAIDQMISHLDIMKYRIENSDRADILPDAASNIAMHISQLEDIKTKVELAETPDELQDVAHELKDQWLRIRLETRYYAGILINHRLDRFITKSDNVSMRMDDVLGKLKDEGKETAELEEIASNFNELVKEARDRHEESLDLYETHPGFDSNGTVTDIDQARDFLNQAFKAQKETLKTLKAAGRELKHFLNKAKKSNHRAVVVKGNGTLEAHGNGRAVIEGNVTVTLSGNVTLIVSENANVTTNGTGTREVLGNGNVKYKGFGSATISGDDIKIGISGNDIDLTATGTGRAVLNGRGTYETTGDFGVSGEYREVE